MDCQATRERKTDCEERKPQWQRERNVKHNNERVHRQSSSRPRRGFGTQSSLQGSRSHAARNASAWMTSPKQQTHRMEMSSRRRLLKVHPPAAGGKPCQDNAASNGRDATTRPENCARDQLPLGCDMTCDTWVVCVESVAVERLVLEWDLSGGDRPSSHGLPGRRSPTVREKLSLPRSAPSLFSWLSEM